MKNYKVKALRNFTDGLEKINREKNDIFECNKERYEILKSKGAVELVEIQEIIDNAIKEITEEEVQAVASSIVEEAKEQDKTIEEVVNEIVDEIVESEEINKVIDEKVDEVVEEIITKKKKSSKK